MPNTNAKFYAKSLTKPMDWHLWLRQKVFLEWWWSTLIYDSFWFLALTMLRLDLHLETGGDDDFIPDHFHAR
jgi:hypothetical protein